MTSVKTFGYRGVARIAIEKIIEKDEICKKEKQTSVSLYVCIHVSLPLSLCLSINQNVRWVLYTSACPSELSSAA